MEQTHPWEGEIQKALLSEGDSMFFKPKPQQPPNAIHYVVSFLSLNQTTTPNHSAVARCA